MLRDFIWNIRWDSEKRMTYVIVVVYFFGLLCGFQLVDGNLFALIVIALPPIGFSIGVICVFAHVGDLVINLIA